MAPTFATAFCTVSVEQAMRSWMVAAFRPAAVTSAAKRRAASG